jgi:hypothetical protein
MRVANWESKLADVIDRARSTRYELGVHDCFSVACEVLEALTGVDRWPEFSGRYSTKGEALTLIREYGQSFDLAFSWFFGCEPIDVKFARTGDILKYVDPHGEAHLGVCVGAHAAVLGAGGLLFVPRAECALCWGVA